jgi:hypothetical protein
MLRPVCLALLVAACGGKGKGAAGPSARYDTPGTVTAAVEGHPSRFVVRITHDNGDLNVLVNVPAAVEKFDQVTADVSEVQGSEGRLFLVQMFSEVGEDEFTRDIEVWVIDALRDAVLWTGAGTYNNSFGECETLNDVPEPTMEGRELVVRLAKGTEKIEPTSERCESVPLEHNEVVRVELH